MRLPIRLRITIWYVVLLAMLVAALGLFVAVRLRADLIGGLDATLDTRASQIALGLGSASGAEFQDVSDAALQGLPGSESAAQLLDAEGSVLQAAGDAAGETPMIGRADIATVLGGDPVRFTAPIGPDAESFRVLAVELTGTPARIVVVATSLETVENSVGRLTVLLLLAGPAVLIVAGLGGWWIARAALAPVSRLTRTAGEIGIKHLDERVAVPRTADEIHDLAVTMNGMLERLEHGVAAQRRFISDASHELRTPLAVMRSELEVDLREPDLAPAARARLESVHEEIESMGALVEDLLTLARADEGRLELAVEPVDLRASAARVRDALASFADAGGTEVRLEGDATPCVADRRRVEQVLRNLMANAIKYAGRGGHVVVTTRTADGSARCSVADDGPGVPASARPHVFDRFFRADPSRTGGGAGLGLAICREIVQAHGGRIELVSKESGGSTFTFAIPLGDEPDGGVRRTPPS